MARPGVVVVMAIRNSSLEKIINIVILLEFITSQDFAKHFQCIISKNPLENPHKVRALITTFICLFIVCYFLSPLFQLEHLHWAVVFVRFSIASI